MSIIHAFDPISPEIVKAKDVSPDVGGPPKRPFPKTVLMNFSEKLLDQVRAAYNPVEIGFLYEGVRMPIYQIRIPAELLDAGQAAGEAAGQAAGRAGQATDHADSQAGQTMDHADSQAGQTMDHAAGEPLDVAIFRSGIGAPLAAGLMEEVIARGAENFIVFGSCGALVPGLATGRLILPTEAYRDEGTSYHYAPPADYIKIRNAGRMEEIFRSLDIPYVTGKLWTTDALYRETVDKTQARRDEGCIGVDMECAALQAVCDFRGKELYQFVYAEDSLESEQWDARNMGHVTQNEYDTYLRIALSVAARI